jgi:hypothetical protein
MVLLAWGVLSPPDGHFPPGPFGDPPDAHRARGPAGWLSTLATGLVWQGVFLWSASHPVEKGHP